MWQQLSSLEVGEVLPEVYPDLTVTRYGPCWSPSSWCAVPACPTSKT